MQVNGASKSFVYVLNQADRRVQSERSAPIEYDLIERAAEALFDFVFSGCDRLDGKRFRPAIEHKKKISRSLFVSSRLQADL
jgi:hypothetical protein